MLAGCTAKDLYASCCKSSTSRFIGLSGALRLRNVKFPQQRCALRGGEHYFLTPQCALMLTLGFDALPSRAAEPPIAGVMPSIITRISLFPPIIRSKRRSLDPPTPVLRCKVAGDVQNQLRQSVSIGVDLAACARRHNRHVRRDRSVVGVQGGNIRLSLTVGPQRQVAQ